MPQHTTVTLAELTRGATVVVEPDYPRSTWGQGGTVHRVDADGVELRCGTDGLRVTYTAEQLAAGRVLLQTPYPAADCIEAPDGCRGPVEYRPSAGGSAYLRCDGHWHALCDRQDRIRADYPDTSSAPGWFDPSYGEQWDSDY